MAPNKTPSLQHSSPSVDRILDAALHVFTQKGYDGASIREIMTEANVTQPVIYYHFGNKQELFKAVVERNMQLFFSELEASIKDLTDHWQRLSAVMKHHFAFHRRYPGKSTFLFGVYFGIPRFIESQRLLDLGYQILYYTANEIVALQEEGVVREGDPDLMALELIGAFNMFKMRNMFEPDFVCDDAKADLILRGFLYGNATPEALTAMQSAHH